MYKRQGLSHFGLEIVAAFDVKPELVGTTLSGIPIYHSDEFKQKTAYEMESRDWSSDVCSSDLTSLPKRVGEAGCPCVLASMGIAAHSSA